MQISQWISTILQICANSKINSVNKREVIGIHQKQMNIGERNNGENVTFADKSTLQQEEKYTM